MKTTYTQKQTIYTKNKHFLYITITFNAWFLTPLETNYSLIT